MGGFSRLRLGRSTCEVGSCCNRGLVFFVPSPSTPVLQPETIPSPDALPCLPPGPYHPAAARGRLGVLAAGQMSRMLSRRGAWLSPNHLAGSSLAALGIGPEPVPSNLVDAAFRCGGAGLFCAEQTRPDLFGTAKIDLRRATRSRLHRFSINFEISPTHRTLAGTTPSDEGGSNHGAWGSFHCHRLPGVFPAFCRSSGCTHRLVGEWRPVFGYVRL